MAYHPPEVEVTIYIPLQPSEGAPQDEKEAPFVYPDEDLDKKSDIPPRTYKRAEKQKSRFGCVFWLVVAFTLALIWLALFRPALFWYDFNSFW